MEDLKEAKKRAEIVASLIALTEKLNPVNQARVLGMAEGMVIGQGKER